MAPSTKTNDSAPQFEEPQDNDYKSRTGQSEIPVVADDRVEDVDVANADSDEQLERDDADAIDESNILDERTRGASQKKGAYTEPEDEDEITEANERQ